MVQVGRPILFVKLLFSSSALLTVLISSFDVRLKKSKEEFYFLLLTSLLGLNVAVSSGNMLLIWLGIELVSLTAYLTVGLRADKKGAEAAIKYALFGMVASAVMLYGMSLQYGINGNMNLYGVSAGFEYSVLPSLLVAVGFLFKIAAFPFHIWSPDVYEGSPPSFLAFNSTVSKIMGILLLAALFSGAISFTYYPIQKVLVVISACSLLVGNFSALRQKNIKRMLAYSSVAQAGFMLATLPAVIGPGSGIKALFFYAVIYTIANAGVFAVITFFEARFGYEQIADYKGLGLRKPWWGIMFLILLISLAGLPPTAGFTSKMLVFSSLWETYNLSGDPWLIILLVFAVLNTVISLFYYLKIPYFMFFHNKEPRQSSFQNETFPVFFTLILTILAVMFFFRPELLFNFINLCFP